MSNLIDVAYHAGCLDGKTSLFTIESFFKDADIKSYSCAYGHGTPKFRDGAKVYIVDFAFPNADMKKLLSSSDVTWIDHHPTSAEANSDLLDHPNVLHSTKYSGALLTYAYLHNIPVDEDTEAKVPWLHRFVSDRDLWEFKHKETMAVTSFMHTLVYSQKLWEEKCGKALLQSPGLVAGPADSALLRDVIEQGTAILRSNASIVSQVIHHAHPMEIAGCKVLAVNASSLMSDIGNKMLDDNPSYDIAAVYYHTKVGTVKFSLRTKEGSECRSLAEKFGGGGHPHASGFTIPYAAFTPSKVQLYPSK